VPDTAAYQQRLAQGESVREELEEIDAATRARERIMFGLRMREGVPREEFLADLPSLEKLKVNGLALEETGRIRLTARGRLVADSVAALFV
jgi:oxygen-independent coproporphyrinogen-3 oxidase